MAKHVTIAVPMSGCLRSSAKAAPTTSSSGLKRPPSVCVLRGRAASSWAAYRTSASLSSSEGWNWSGPAASQRVAPLTSTPTPGIITATVRKKAAMSSSGVMALIEAKPRREAR